MLWLAKTSLLHHFYMLGISACMCVVSIPLNLLLSVNVSLFLYGSLLANMLARETNIYMLVLTESTSELCSCSCAAASNDHFYHCKIHTA